MPDIINTIDEVLEWHGSADSMSVRFGKDADPDIGRYDYPAVVQIDRHEHRNGPEFWPISAPFAHMLELYTRDIAELRTLFTGCQVEWHFPNGFGLSVITDGHGRESGHVEAAVLHRAPGTGMWQVFYRSGLTVDVVTLTSMDELETLLDKVRTRTRRHVGRAIRRHGHERPITLSWPPWARMAELFPSDR